MRPSVPTGFCTGSRPKTCTVPDWARSIPRRCLMRVVLPAPLPPISPKTPPRGTVSETSARAVLVSNWRVSRCTSTTGGAAEGKGSDMDWFLVSSSFRGVGTWQSGVALLEEFNDVVEGDIHLPGFGQERVDALGEDLDALATGQGGALVGHIGAGRAALLDNPRGFQLAI